MANFTEEQLTQLKTALQKRYIELQQEIHNELHSDNAQDVNLSDTISGIPDDIDTALVDRQINEMREIEVSLKHLSELEFGDCIDCDHEIGFSRLIAYPSAQRCITCQNQYEKAYPHESTSSL
ncbi:transcriptional regulator, TraR/DksA family [Nitrosomonas cryotolerans]|uniref:Transcriptional regulator, TraR/DksA family n=1 Tax=Nitrosomonas cryotolerans ATCC 49181 TaxID=1131553 RepID=A0A1N6FVN6_9PROT|nr:TraR/DksA family transcriptional regulator [Nitrosomonas cryotolerans]SFP76188.1 transcriptional regulator, TraR/DksA family [Nitrosomonas cryotolerans]SIN99396.1 transcriptional regulator, TraR/DksA family [Nitrosomonas cryotolerans ATCC 49181]